MLDSWLKNQQHVDIFFSWNFFGPTSPFFEDLQDFSQPQPYAHTQYRFPNLL